MDSIKKENIRQDLQDYIDKRAFGPKVSRRQRKEIVTPLNLQNGAAYVTGAIHPVNPVPKKEIKNRIHSTISALVGKSINANMLP